MNADDPVRRALEALRTDDASLRVSKRVEEAVFSAFEAHSQQGRNGGMALGMAAAAILAAAISYVLVMAPSNLAPARKESVAAPATAEVLSPPRVAAPAIDSGTRPPSVNADYLSPAAPTLESGKPRVTMDHVSVRSEYVQTVQARIPRSYLPLLGIPVIDPEAGGTVGIEILVGEYGQRQAIRIVR
jgi:hypothetical protein